MLDKGVISSAEILIYGTQTTSWILKTFLIFEPLFLKHKLNTFDHKKIH